MYQPCSFAGQPARPRRPAAPAPVRTAAKFMYGGAAVSAVPLIVALAYASDIRAYHLRCGGATASARPRSATGAPSSSR